MQQYDSYGYRRQAARVRDYNRSRTIIQTPDASRSPGWNTIVIQWRLLLHLLAAGMLLCVVPAAPADEICTDRMEFEKDGWQLEPVQHAMDDYLRDHRMRVNWLREPRPPSAVGRDYYEWLWTHDFGVEMKAELLQRFCAGAPAAGAGE